MNSKEAEELSILLMQITAKLDQSVKFVMDKDSPENFESYKSNVGKAMGDLYLEVLQPLWEKYPDLKPEQMGGTYKVNPEIYKPYFYTQTKT